MQKELRCSAIGLDTMHTVEFARLMMDSSTAPGERVDGMKMTRCMSFETPFQNREGLAKRRAYLESLGVKVTECFEEAVADCDAILLDIDDASLHKPYFELCARTGKPLYLDKPFADSVRNMLSMIRTAEESGTRFFTASALRYSPGVRRAAEEHPDAETCGVYGALGDAPAGSSLIWYSVHCFEILERIMGRGAKSLFYRPDPRGGVCVVDYPDGRRGTVDFIRGTWDYGGIIHTSDGKHCEFHHDPAESFYTPLLRDCVRFFRNLPGSGVPLADSIEIMRMIEAAERSSKSGKTERLVEE